MTIVSAPPPGVEIGGHSTKVLFRFFVRNHAQVRGFVCKLDKRPLRRCRSPKGYRVGLGRHVFRVRAIGWTGLRGPQEVRRFKVCHPTRIGSCIRGAPVTPTPPQSHRFAATAAAPTSLHFRLPASNGYSFQVKTQGSQTLVSVWRNERTAKTSAIYDVSESATPEAINADLGSLGHIDVRFVPSGETRTIELRPPRKHSDCQAPLRVVRGLGTFTGTISFHGEDGYTSVDAAQAWGSVGPEVHSRCGRRPPRGGPSEAPPDVERVWIKEDAFLFARHVSSKTSTGTTLLLVSTSRRYARYLVEKLEIPRPGLTIQRSASVAAPRSAFTFRGDLSSATLRPPAPFEGEATFSAARHSLSGDLTVALPGAPPEPLTGPEFEAQIDPTR